ncbi:DUF2218 domain-containing protein [Glacieibacterium megasporae]|uniref:DUF2218 domain-containing protein n=1 Tax=Glacieibacterium megasporae TaxID=2835787 RepID=UPI001C1E8C77|nr:DUF2218 domain-containing protein [Polymorphobacter megasporae]UAJ11235.1 DUF2218 domain-containing protein [Polymorphobacter megasporae]
MDSVATIPTANGSKYLQQLCKHWSHKFEVSFDPAAGTIPFPTSVLHLAASPEALTLTLTAPDAAVFDRMEGVVIEHLQRFAFREELKADWVRA